MALNKADRAEECAEEEKSAPIAVKKIKRLIIRIPHILRSLYQRGERYSPAASQEAVQSIRESLLLLLKEQDI